MLLRTDPTPLDPQDSRPDSEPASAAWTFARPGLPAWVGLFVFSVAVVCYAVHSMFLFADDFIFVRQAREMPFNRLYIRDPLFQHYSPVTRVVNAMLAPLLPHWRAAPFFGLVVMDILVVLSGILLMVALFGRTWFAWAGSLLLGTSLSLLPTMHWWTAGLNILPAMAGVSAAFGAMVLYLRGRSAWWVALAVFGYFIAVSDYELGMLMPGYLFLWLLLFGRQALDTPIRAVLRRTWWAWTVLGVMLVLSVLNYKIDYYVPAPKAPLNLVGQGLLISLFHALLPSIVGMHGDRDSLTWDRFSTTVGIVLTLALLLVTLRRNWRAWKGWAFALIGWLLPALALLVNRLGYSHSTGVATNLIYQYLALSMFLVGVMEAMLTAGMLTRYAAIRRPRPQVLRPVAVGVTAACVLMAIAWVYSVQPTIRPQNIAKSSRNYVSIVQHGAAVAARGGPYGLLDATVPGGLISRSFAPYNRASRVVGLYSPDLPFDAAAPRMFGIDPHGHVYPVAIRNLVRIEPAGTAATMSADGVSNLHQDPSKGLCFTTGPASRITVALPQPVKGSHLVVRTQFTVGAPTTERVLILPTDVKSWIAANGDPKTWQPGETALYDTVANGTTPAGAPVSSLSSLQIARFTPGVPVCVSSIQVGDATRAGKSIS